MATIINGSGIITNQVDATVINQNSINVTDDTELALKADRTFAIGGDGYAWVDETANRVAGTTYTNTYGKSIEVVIGTANSSGFFWTLDGTNLVGGSGVTFSNRFALSFIVPNNSTYSVSGSGLETWLELK